MIYKIINNVKDISGFEWESIAYVIHELKEYYCYSTFKEFFLRFCIVNIKKIENKRYVILWGLKKNKHGTYLKDNNNMLFNMELNKTIQYINHITPLRKVFHNFKLNEYKIEVLKPNTYLQF